MPYEVRPPQIIGNYLRGRAARQEEEQAGQMNALRGLQLQSEELQLQRQQRLNALAPDATPEQYVRAGDVQTGAALSGMQRQAQTDKQQALAQLGALAQKALTITDPAQRKGFLAQAQNVYGPAFTALGADLSQFPQMLAMPDAELEQRLSQVAQFAPAAEPAAGFTLDQGQTRFDAKGKPIASVAPKPTVTPADKPLPVGALRMAQDARDALSVAAGIDSALANIDSQIQTGKLNLGPMRNLISKGQNVSGLSDANSRNFQLMRSTLEKMRNDSLRLNKGVQTEGDAQRAWDELFASLNDEKAVRSQLSRIRDINKRATILQQENFDAVYENYGRTAPSTAPVTSTPAADTNVPSATGPKGEKIYFRNGKWGP